MDFLQLLKVGKVHFLGHPLEDGHFLHFIPAIYNIRNSEPVNHLQDNAERKVS